MTDRLLAGIREWLFDEGRQAPTNMILFDQLCHRLTAEGLPLWRAVVQFGTLHPLYQAHSLFWWRDTGIEHVQRSHEFMSSPEFHASTYKHILDRGGMLRVRLTGMADLKFKLLSDLKEQGGTDFLMTLMPVSEGISPGLSWTTDRREGFSTAEIELLRALPRYLGPLMEVRSLKLTMTTLLDTYLGRGPAHQVLSGAVRRGELRRVSAVVVLTDLHEFTAKAESWEESELLGALDGYLEIVVDAVSANGGEVLKFMGDGVLAIFAVTDERPVNRCCDAALRALMAARQALAQLNGERLRAGKDALEFGSALHVGDLAYGNVGGRERLDFTVIGSAVNLASRLLRLCKVLDAPILATEEIARHSVTPMNEIGARRLRGAARPVRVFAPIGAGRFGG
ncbi:MAG: adenylate/guanylate cyclase domain-containing protein [Dongiaceae bacterium]